MGYLGAFGAAGLMAVTFGICVATALFSMAWLRYRAMGPLEWLLRAIAYGTFRPAHRPAAADTLARSPPI